MSADAWLTLGGVSAFSLVWLGLARNIGAIARRNRNPPSFHPVLGVAHVARFAGWALVGAATLSVDPWTGALLLSTRIPATALVVVTFMQRRELRPSAQRLVSTLGPLLLGLGLACAAVAWLQPRLAPTSPPALLSFLPGSTWLLYLLNAFVLVAFSVQVMYALPLQIAAALRKPLGNLRWFQLGLLVNYAYALVYAGRVEDPLIARVMAWAYSAVLVEQVVLVAIIERGVRRYRRAAV